jgi:uridine kinase
MNNYQHKIITGIRNKAISSKIPIIVAIDGCSGSGKTTIANQIKSELNAVIIPLDDFFSANIPDSKWEEFTIIERLHNVFTWDLLRREVLIPLKEGRKVTWFSFDFNSRRTDGTYDMERKPKISEPADIIILEGAYSSSPILEDLVDMTILIELPIEECHSRLATRDEKEFLLKWHRIWDEAEEYYFTKVRPRESFTIVVKS